MNGKRGNAGLILTACSVGFAAPLDLPLTKAMHDTWMDWVRGAAGLCYANRHPLPVQQHDTIITALKKAMLSYSFTAPSGREEVGALPAAVWSGRWSE